MKKTSTRAASAAQSKPVASLPYGLRELAPLRIFSGTLATANGQMHLQAADGSYAVDAASPFAVDRRLDGQRVSILGYPSEREPASAATGASIIALKLVTHEAVSLRAYAVHESHRERSAVDNWLFAQQELLER